MAFAPAVWLAAQAEIYEDDEETESNTFPEPQKRYLDDYDDDSLFDRFHLTRPCITFITDCVRLRMKATREQINGPCVDEIVIAALDYYANGILSSKVVDLIQMDHQEIHEVINKVSKVLSGMVKEFITFPANGEERANVAHEIKKICGIPTSVGLVGCMHVKVRPPQHDKDAFRNTMDNHTVMTQVICDCEGNFMSVENCCVGSTPEQTIWDSSEIALQLKRGVHGTNWIIAGKGYTLSRHLLTAVSPVREKADRRFNAAHSMIYSVFQRTITSLKRRFRCLANLGHVQQNSLDKKAEIIKACCVLHNIAKKFSVPALGDITLEPIHPANNHQVPVVEVPSYAEKARAAIIGIYFSHSSGNDSVSD
ncbi:putative nuclease HARBI1 isoform X2 [Esox lucius]|uniref:Putative nuclease HARBI1 n=1 Tax=Esox lucius TaxID=8010 RepID=A0A3P8ZNB7_ESOLU|nr:putative nuclease HARBI1 isoform X2 [Esox lucius]